MAHFDQSSHSIALTYTNFSPTAFFSQTVVDICRLLPETKVPELVVSILALFVLIVVKELNGCYREKLPMPIPIELIVVGLLLFFFLLTLSTSLILQDCSTNISSRGRLVHSDLRDG